MSKYNKIDKSFYDLILGFFVKKGNKVKAKKILDETFFIIQKETNKPLSILIGSLFYRLFTVVEVRKISTKKRSHFVPFIINPKRRDYLTIKWLKEAVLKDKRKVSLSQKLASEILCVLANKPCHSLELKKNNQTQAFSNRSNIYYRW